jgi:hypothetical protein
VTILPHLDKKIALQNIFRRENYRIEAEHEIGKSAQLEEAYVIDSWQNQI